MRRRQKREKRFLHKHLLFLESIMREPPANLSVPSSFWKEIGARIAATREAAGPLTQKRFAEMVGTSQNTISAYERGDREPALSVLLQIAARFEKPLDWLMFGAEGSQAAVATLAAAPPVSVPDGFVPVPRLQVRASAGSGAVAVPEDLEDDGVVMFREAWMRRIGVNPRTAQALTAVGDSMEPTIRDGDLLLVDRSIDRIVDNGIYVVVLGGMVLVKRVQVKRDGSVVLRSDNTDLYEAELVPADEVHALTVEGRVRWFGRTI